MVYSGIFKPIIDKLVALFGFILLSPVFVLCTLLLYVVNGGSPFFFQNRPGRKGRIFKVIKFRTMTDKTDGKGVLLSDAERLTQIGKFIRNTSLDEIPQLLNVIKGEMSLVGPRPLLVEYIPLYNDVQNRRHEVCPGITGWAQVNGRNAISWEEKFAYDVWYVDNLSLSLDLKIILMTVLKVFKSEGITQQGHATMPLFEGNKKL
jgi:undecaprenyl phosphate N,N'-diacetylbacillosamine 1-phosphate transferase